MYIYFKYKPIKSILVSVLFLFSISSSGQTNSGEIIKIIKKDEVSDLKTLLKKDSINECSTFYTYLGHAIISKSTACFNWLLDNGADPDKSCGIGKPPAFVVCKYGTLEMMKKLVSKRVNLDVSLGSLSLLHYAKEYNRHDIVEYLESLKDDKIQN